MTENGYSTSSKPLNELKSTPRGREVFDADELVQTWRVHHLQIIGEAAGNLSGDLRQRHTEIVWQQIVAMRNILVHDYFGVDEDEVWTTVQFDIPNLKKKIEDILKTL